jgi:ribosomal protein S18 acetylase RimI-like enzyme
MVEIHKVTFRKAEPNDLDYLVQMENRCFEADGFSRRRLLYLIKYISGYFLLAVKGNNPAGYLILLEKKNSKKIRVYSIAVNPENQGMGIAQRLMDFTEKTALQRNFTSITLEVKEDNLAAINLYRKNGFFTYGEKGNYYADGSKALLMKKILNM